MRIRQMVFPRRPEEGLNAKYPLYKWIKVRVLAQLKGDCSPDTLKLSRSDWYLTDYITSENYRLGKEYILFLHRCEEEGPICAPFSRFEYNEGLVTGRIKSLKVETMSVAEFLSLLETE